MSLPTPQEERCYETLRQKRRALYREQNQVVSVNPEVIFIGDSITEFFPLQKLLESGTEMANRGISASRTDHILDHLDCHLYGENIRQIVLMIGVNDLGYGVSEDDIIANMIKLMEAIFADYPFVSLLLLEVLPVNESACFAKTVGLRTNRAIKSLNKAYAELANRYFNVTVLPTFDAFLDNTGQLKQEFTVDGLHLTPSGYQQLASQIQPSL